jgi:phosphoribosylformimino-5-aminoimidazole carboxamide ribotide isomerase
MEILPAIDLRDGKVVRLAQGDYDRQTIYSREPAAVAREFLSAGARWIHVVDLDAARTGQRTNAEAIRSICAGVNAAVELGGGIRDEEALRAALELGVSRVVIGSAALKDWPWFERLVGGAEFATKVVLGLDARAGRLAVDGWTEQAGLTVAEVAERASGLSLAAIIYTDIERDGMLTGPDLERTARLIARTQTPVIASGGVRRLEDIARCREIGCAGVIIGRAYYEGRIDLEAALAVARK